MAATVDIEALRRLVGRREEDEDLATAAPLRGMAVTFDRPEPPPGLGEAVPPGWASGLLPGGLATRLAG